jgi:hypothetical protein
MVVFSKRGVPFRRSLEDNETSLVSMENGIYFEQEAEGLHILQETEREGRQKESHPVSEPVCLRDDESIPV